MIDGTVELLSRLVAIDSVNPSLVAGGAGEREIAAFVAGWARDSGLEVTVLEATPGRPSVVVRARGSADGPDAAPLRPSRHGHRRGNDVTRTPRGSTATASTAVAPLT